MKRGFIIISAIILSSILIIYFIAMSSNQNLKNNGFERKFTSSIVHFKSVTVLPNSSFGFAGIYNNKILLKNYSNPLKFYSVNSMSNQLDTIKINFVSNFKSKARNIYNDIQFSNFYSSNLYGEINVSNGNENPILFNASNLRTDHFKAVSPNGIIARSRKRIGKETYRDLIKLDLAQKITIEQVYQLPRQKNAFFATDGFLQYDADHKLFFYMYYYRGEFLALDTNLNLLYKSKTVDTISLVKISVDSITVKNKKGISKQVTQSRPPLFVNTFITTNGERVYVLSKLKADNESHKDFGKNQVIDVYNISDGSYLYSFYIPKYLKDKLNQFYIDGNSLVAIFGKYLVKYELVENKNS